MAEKKSLKKDKILIINTNTLSINLFFAGFIVKKRGKNC